MNALKETGYPVEYIISDVLRTQRMSSIKDALALTWVHEKAPSHKKHKLAAVCYAYYADLAEYMSSYFLNVPEGSDLFIIASKDETLEAYRKVFEKPRSRKWFGKVSFLLKPNRGRDISSLLVTFAPYARDYEAFCFVHDKKSKQVPFTLHRDFLSRCMECCLWSREYVADLVEELFDESSRTGVMMPPVPYFSEYFTPGAETFGRNTELLQALMGKLKLKVPFDDALMTPFGTMF